MPSSLQATISQSKPKTVTFSNCIAQGGIVKMRLSENEDGCDFIEAADDLILLLVLYP